MCKMVLSEPFCRCSVIPLKEVSDWFHYLYFLIMDLRNAKVNLCSFSLFVLVGPRVALRAPVAFANRSATDSHKTAVRNTMTLRSITFHFVAQHPCPQNPLKCAQTLPFIYVDSFFLYTTNTSVYACCHTRNYTQTINQN